MENLHQIESASQNTIDFRRLFAVLRRGVWLFVLAVVLGGGTAFTFSKLQTPIYKATTQVIIARPSSSQAVVTDVTQTLNSQQVADTYVELLSQPWVVLDLSKRVGGAVSSGALTISAVTNTQIIDIQVKDPDPKRAALIADTLVQILIEQNDQIQSGRYNEAEKNLNTQIDQVSQQISTTQDSLKQANASALEKQIATTKDNIQQAQARLDSLQSEIASLQELYVNNSAPARLAYDQDRQATLQTLLETQQAQLDLLKQKQATDPQVSQDATYAASLKTQIDNLAAAFDGTRQQMVALAQEITWITPLVDPAVLSTTLATRKDELTTEQSLLGSYQKTYIDLLTTQKIVGSTDEIENLKKNLSLYQEIYVNLLSSRETVRLNRMQNILAVVQTKPALASSKPVSPTIPLNTILGAVGTLAFAVALLLLMEALDSTIKTQEDVERSLSLPVMGYALFMEGREGDKETGPYVARVPRSPAAEAFRSLRTNLEFIGVDKPIRSLLISSPGASEGKTTIASNLAAVVAQSGKKVVLLDADFRRPRIHRAMGLSNRIGLSDVFRDKLTLQDVIQHSEGLSLSVITSGGIPPNPAELLASEKMKQILDELKSEYDLVIIDSTPTIVTDSQLIAARVDGVLLVLQPGQTNVDAARNCVVQYRRVGAKMLGVVMNGTQQSIGYGGYYYYSNYQYYRYDHDEPAPRKRLNLPWGRTKAAAVAAAASKETEEKGG